VFDKKGYFHTGDMGHFDTQGNLFIDGRKPRIFKTSNAENVSADELENLITAYPGIAEARVYVENDKIAVVLYATDDVRTDAENIISQINAKLPSYKRIKTYRIEPYIVGSQIK
jgi:long-subunit acyl-CoA synthetase (AMP-forming)